MTSKKQFIAKSAALVAGLGLALSSFAALPAAAQTTTSNASLMAQIAALQAQIAALQAQLSGSATVSVTFTRDLTIGATGSDVVALQTWLIGKGYSIPAGATGYFGVQTRAAVAAFQAANGIVPAVGYFGPITRGRVIAMMGTGSTGGGGGSTAGALQGGSGQLKNVDSLGDVESSLNEGDSATKVIGFEATAQDSDLAVQRVDVNFTIDSGSNSANLDKYVDTVALYQDGKKLTSMDASAGDKSGREWTFRFSDVNGVIREGDTSNFYVEVTPVSSISSDEADKNITAEIPDDGIRAVDAEGVSETYGSGLDTNDFSVSTATRGQLTLNEASDNPDDSVVKADENNTTDDVTLLSFNAKAKNQDITIDTLPVGLHVTGTTNVGDVVQSVSLMQGSNTIKTKTIGASSGNYTQVVFDNLSEDISKDDSQPYSVVATIRKIGTGSSGTAFDAGDTLVASTTSGSSQWDVEDGNGDTATISGSVTGGIVTFQTTGITVAKTDASYTKTVGQNPGEGDSTQYSITFKVTAGDDDLFIDRSIQNTRTPSATGGGVAWATTTSSNSNVTSTGIANLSANDSNTGDTTTSFKVPSGTTRTFTLNVTLTATATGYTGVALTGINYDTDSNTNDSALYYTAGLDTFKTADVSMSTH